MQGKNIGGLIGQIGADMRQWEKAHDKLMRDFEKTENRGQQMATKLQSSLNKVADRASQMGRTLSMRVTAPIAGLATLAVREFGNFDAAMNKSIAIMGDMTEVMEQDMTNAARDIGRTTRLSAQEAAESYFYLASAGLDAEQSMAALPQVAAFAQAGMFDMAQATDLATDAQSALGLTVDDAQDNLRNLTRVTDVLVKANTLANATVEQFSTALTREAGAALKSFNKDIEEGVAVLAAFADQGVKGEIAGTGLSRIMRLITDAAVNNKEAMDRLNISVFDSEGRMNNMADIISDLENAFSGMTDAQRTAELANIGFSARVQGVILPLLGTSDAIREYESELRNAAGTTGDIASNQMRDFNAQLKLLWDNVKDIGISFGQTLEPAMRTLINLAKAATQTIQEMSDEMRKRVLIVAGLFASSGPLLVGFAVVTKSVAVLAGVFLTKFALIGAVVGSVVAGVVASGQWMVDNWDRTVAKTKYILGLLELGFKNAALGIMKIVERMIGFFVNNTGAGMIGKIFGFDVGSFATDLIGLQDAISDFESNIEETGKNVRQHYIDYWTLPYTTVTESFGNAIENGKDYFLSGLSNMLEGGETMSMINSFQEKLNGALSGGNNGSSGAPIKPTVGASAPNDNIINIWEELSNQITGAGLEVKNFDHRFRHHTSVVSDKANQMAFAVSNSVNKMTGQFFEGIGRMAAGSETLGGVFNTVLTTLADLAIRVGKIAIAVGVGVAGIKKALKSLNPVAAFAAGAALIALGSYAKSALAKAADSGSGSPARTTGISPNTSVSTGSSLQSTGIPSPSITPSNNKATIINNQLNLDGQVVWKNQKKVNHKRQR